MSGEIQQPKRTWYTPGAIQVAKGIQAIHSIDEPRDKRFSVLSRALSAAGSPLAASFPQMLQSRLRQDPA